MLESLNRLFDDKRMTIAAVYIWFVILILMFWQLGIFESQFMSFGPNEHLTYMGVKVDTWSEYSLIASYIGISTFVNDLASDSIGPFLSNNIADFKTRVLPYTPRTCLIISQLWSLYCSVASIASLYVAFSQADLLVLRIIVDLCVNYYTTSRYIRNKKYDPESYRKFFDDEGDECAQMIHPTDNDLKVSIEMDASPDVLGTSLQLPPETMQNETVHVPPTRSNSVPASDIMNFNMCVPHMGSDS